MASESAIRRRNTPVDRTGSTSQAVATPIIAPITISSSRSERTCWVDALIDCRQHAISLIENGETPGEVRKAIGAARKAMREPEEILQALQNLHRSMTSHV